MVGQRNKTNGTAVNAACPVMSLTDFSDFKHCLKLFGP